MENKLHLEQLKQTYENREVASIVKMRQFGIMALLTERNGELAFVLNKRAATIRQAGDICFPGGRQEENETILETALRETEEELGIPREKIQVVGKSDYLLLMHRGKLQPFIGFVPYEVLHGSTRNCSEVEEIFTIPLSYLIENPPEWHRIHWNASLPEPFPVHRINGGKDYFFGTYKAPSCFYEYKGRTIWGMTAQIMANIVETLQEK